MLFNSFTFFAFLAIVFAVTRWTPPRYWTAKKVFLLAASYLFYGWWDYRFLALLIVSSVTDHIVVRRLQAGPKQPRRWLAVSLVVNLGLLGFFKYWNFFADSAEAALAQLGVDASAMHLDLVLPVGISFYTFQTLSLTIDTYRGRIPQRQSLLDIALYVAMFPQLVAGPIVRATGFLWQLRRPRRANTPQLAWGGWLIVLGLFKKTVIADNMARLVDAVYARDDLTTLTSWESWQAAFAFAIQIYNDFSGYSDIAIGTAALLGFRFPVNFRSPYTAFSFSDFWRRWHISLSSWLRDYLYIPLGGNRRGALRTYASLMTTMLLGGLWHGASWNFVVWGGVHGVLLAIERVLGRSGSRPDGRLADLVRTSFVGLVVVVTWVPFRAPDFDSTLQVLASMFGSVPSPADATDSSQWPIFALAAAGWTLEYLRSIGLLPVRTRWWLRSIAAGAMLYAIATMRGASHAFIYFQF